MPDVLGKQLLYFVIDSAAELLCWRNLSCNKRWRELMAVKITSAVTETLSLSDRDGDYIGFGGMLR
ncbi:hypothetical protein FD723_41120 (plasmid) [Nostoc sp. C052]|uniref:hypothetical protein n=1 Tax=Nostoc sp. C052 TaxID=2576902 RepID=UPI0015C333FD|nr:hypothetical protein [Nostoc sp. C052]QLE46611.1 hypothetical protein FD723_41120 [Nostoc sp. C052]